MDARNPRLSVRGLRRIQRPKPLMHHHLQNLSILPGLPRPARSRAPKQLEPLIVELACLAKPPRSGPFTTVPRRDGHYKRGA